MSDDKGEWQLGINARYTSEEFQKEVQDVLRGEWCENLVKGRVGRISKMCF